MTDYQTILKQVGDISAQPTAFILKALNDSGILVNEVTAKLISILIIAVVVYIIIQFVKSLDKFIKGIIVILLIAIGISIGYSMFIK